MKVSQALKEYMAYGSINGREPSEKLLKAMEVERKKQRGE